MPAVAYTVHLIVMTGGSPDTAIIAGKKCWRKGNPE